MAVPGKRRHWGGDLSWNDSCVSDLTEILPLSGRNWSQYQLEPQRSQGLVLNWFSQSPSEASSLQTFYCSHPSKKLPLSAAHRPHIIPWKLHWFCLKQTEPTEEKPLNSQTMPAELPQSKASSSTAGKQLGFYFAQPLQRLKSVSCPHPFLVECPGSGDFRQSAFHSHSFHLCSLPSRCDKKQR